MSVMLSNHESMINMQSLTKEQVVRFVCRAHLLRRRRRLVFASVRKFFNNVS